MKFAFAFVLIALFAVIAVSKAMPQPEEAVASSNDGASANTKIVMEDAAAQAKGGRYLASWNWNFKSQPTWRTPTWRPPTWKPIFIKISN
uniref:Uncharacterized protein n=1 Tax=Anopheles coluzzii TaxID=1518534 RepID=A0A6E8VSA9_ANOCL